MKIRFYASARAACLWRQAYLPPNICARGRLRVLTDLLHLGYGNVILPQEAAAIPKERIFSFDPPELYSCMAAWCQGRPLTAPALAYLNAVKERIMDGEWTNAR